MKKIHKAIKLPLIYLTALAASAVKAEAPTDITPEVVVKPVEKTPEEMLLETSLVKFFTDPNPNYEPESLESMICEAIPHLEKTELKFLVPSLKKICKAKNKTTVGIELMQHQKKIEAFLKRIVATKILFARLAIALKKNK